MWLIHCHFRYTEGPGASTLPQYINGSVIWPAMNAMTIGLSNDTQNGGLRLVSFTVANTNCIARHSQCACPRAPLNVNGQ